MSDDKPRVAKSRKCECGKPMTADDAEFWGECESCRTGLPIQSSNDGDKRGAATDRAYHGGTGHRGEW